MLVKNIDLHDAALLEKYIESKKDNRIFLSERQKNRIVVIIDKVKKHAKTISNIEK